MMLSYFSLEHTDSVHCLRCGNALPSERTAGKVCWLRGLASGVQPPARPGCSGQGSLLPSYETGASISEVLSSVGRLCVCTEPIA